MKELVKFIAQSLVDKPEEVRIKEVENDNALVLELSVAKEDLGKVIGKQGRMAKVIRTILSAASAKSGRKVLLDIVE